MRTIAEAARALAEGKTSACALTEAALARAKDAGGEGARAFTRLHEARARAEAQASDLRRKAGVAPGPLDGIPVSIKDLFDVAGETTWAGSKVRRDAPAATTDAVIVRRLRAAGAAIVGKTNMSEFAFSGIGTNPHHGTPANPWDRKTRRIPGGSSSGAAISVTDGMALGAIGTDTGGSVRIPAALNGLAGFKPTAARVPQAGCYPLSFSLDSIGPLANSVADCALLDAVMAGEPVVPLRPRPVEGLRLLVPETYLLNDLDPAVSAAFRAALSRLAKAGARIVEAKVPEIDAIPAANKTGGLAAPEAFALHRAVLEARRAEYDPRVAFRIDMGRTMTAADYIDTLKARADLVERAGRRTRDYDALLCPAAACVAPPIAAVEHDDKEFWRYNFLILRNTSAFNFLDRCGYSLPCHEPGSAPVGLMVVGERGGDAALHEIAAGIEAALAA